MVSVLFSSRHHRVLSYVDISSFAPLLSVMFKVKRTGIFLCYITTAYFMFGKQKFAFFVFVPVGFIASENTPTLELQP